MIINNQVQTVHAVELMCMKNIRTFLNCLELKNQVKEMLHNNCGSVRFTPLMCISKLCTRYNSILKFMCYWADKLPTASKRNAHGMQKPFNNDIVVFHYLLPCQVIADKKKKTQNA